MEKLRDPHRILLQTGEVDSRVGEPVLPPALRIDAYAPGEQGYYIVQFTGRVEEAWKQALRQGGGELFDYLPNNSFIVRMDANAHARVSSLGFVQWIGIFQPAYKISPEIGVRSFQDPIRLGDPRLWLLVDLFEAEDVQAVAATLNSMGVDLIQSVDTPRVKRIEIRAEPTHIESIARLTAVRWIEEIGEIQKRNNITKWVLQSNLTNQTPIWDMGLHGEAQVIGHIDGKIDLNHCSFKDSTGVLPGPSHRKLIGYRSSAGVGPPFDSHGTHTAGTAAGDQNPVTGAFGFNGMAYAAKLSFEDLDDINLLNLATAFTNAAADGAQIHTNSWGDDGTTAYTTWARDIDLFSHTNQNNLVIFAVSNLPTLKTPENAKNVLAVGASKQAPNQGSHGSGGKGPTNDGRRKPEIYTPGVGIQSAKVNTTCSALGLTGTSMAAPAIAGAAALVRQYFVEGWYPTGAPTLSDARIPSGSLVKAILINSAMDMTSVSEGGRVGAKYPTNIEGWGRALLERALFFNGQARELIVQDVQHTSGISSDEEVNIPFTVFSNSESLQVTLAWADPAAAVNASIARINDLDLEVINSTNTFLGNVFNTTTGESVQGGTADNLNNLEQVLLKAPAPGNYIARVKGTAVLMGPQGYAIVITGDVSATGGGNQPPVAEANGPYSGKRNVPITFSSMNSTDPDGNIVSYSWDFGDGTPPSNLPNPSHIYTSTGNFTAVLTVTDNNSATDADVAVVTVTR
jgi:hypothetical protein